MMAPMTRKPVLVVLGGDVEALRLDPWPEATVADAVRALLG